MVAKCRGQCCEWRNECYRYRSPSAADQCWDNFDERYAFRMKCHALLPIRELPHRRLMPEDWLVMEMN